MVSLHEENSVYVTILSRALNMAQPILPTVQIFVLFLLFFF